MDAMAKRARAVGLGFYGKVAAAFTFLAALLAATEAEAEPTEPSSTAGEEPDLPTNGYKSVDAYAQKLGRILKLDNQDMLDLRRLLLVQSVSESGGNHKAYNRTQRESKYSRAMYEARGNDKKLALAVGNFDAKRWWFPGSGGWFGLMPTVLLNIVAGRNARGLGLTPEWVTDKWASTVGYAAYLDKLTRRSEWGRSSQDAYAIKAGGAAGSLMDDPEKQRYKTAARNLDRAVKKLGLPSDFGRHKIAARRIFGNRDWLDVYKKGLN